MCSRAILLVVLSAVLVSARAGGPPSMGEAGEPAREWPVDLAPELLLQGHVLGRGVSVEEGRLLIDGINHPGAAVFFPVPEAVPTGARFEFRIAPEGGGARGFGLIFASHSSLDYQYIHFDRYRQVILVRSGRERSWNEIARRRGLDYQPGQWHRAQLDCGAEGVQVQIDGRPALTKEGVDVRPGRFGFYVSDGRVEIRNVVLRGRPSALDPPWRALRRPLHHVVVCADAGAGGYQAFPDVRLLASGEMLCVFYAGFGHVSLPGYAPGGKLPPECPKCGRICLVRSADSGRTWSEAEIVVDTPLDDRDPSITELPGGTLLVTYFSLQAGPDGKGYRFVTSSLVRSTDGGKTWLGPENLFPHWAVSSPVRILSDGRLALPLYYVGNEKSPGGAYGGISFSKDGGKTWSRPIPVGKEGPLHLDAEPDLVELPGGRLLMALRPVMAYSISADGGNTWSTPERIGFQAHCPYFLQLPGGILILAHRIPGTSLHYSLDQGKSWSENVLIDEVGGAYPSLCALPSNFPEGSAFVVYYEEGPGSKIRGRWLRATSEGVRWIEPEGE